jgi:uroporphyrinogen-III decarboxylase
VHAGRLVTEITLQPVRRHGVDAAILFSDIVLPLKAIGVDLDIVPGVGPVVAQPVTSVDDLDSLRGSTRPTSRTYATRCACSSPSSARCR